MTNSLYLPQMMSDPKNKGTLFYSTLKVEDKKVLLFFQFEVNLVRYGDFEFFINLALSRPRRLDVP